MKCHIYEDFNKTEAFSWCEEIGHTRKRQEICKRTCSTHVNYLAQMVTFLWSTASFWIGGGGNMHRNMGLLTRAQSLLLSWNSLRSLWPPQSHANSLTLWLFLPFDQLCCLDKHYHCLLLCWRPATFSRCYYTPCAYWDSKPIIGQNRL